MLRETLKVRIVEGVPTDCGPQGLIIITDPVKNNGWGADELFDGRMGRRIRVTVEVLDNPEEVKNV